MVISAIHAESTWVNKEMTSPCGCAVEFEAECEACSCSHSNMNEVRDCSHSLSSHHLRILHCPKHQSVNALIEAAKELIDVIYPPPKIGTAYYLNPKYLTFNGTIMAEPLEKLEQALARARGGSGEKSA